MYPPDLQENVEGVIQYTGQQGNRQATCFWRCQIIDVWLICFFSFLFRDIIGNWTCLFMMIDRYVKDNNVYQVSRQKPENNK